MKWKQQGKEIDLLYKEHKDINVEKGVYLFGAGQSGSAYGRVLSHYSLLKGYIDNSQTRRNCIGYPVISLDQFISEKSNDIIVMCVSEKNRSDVQNQMEKVGLEYEHHFFNHPNFFQRILPIHLIYNKNNFFVPQSQICLTERCTLKCIKCAHACNMVPRDSKDMAIGEVKKSADYFFDFVDYVGDFVLIGGEPLLYVGIEDVIEYIGNRYRDKMSVLSVTTNGTIRPKDELLKICKKYDVLFRISNYVKAVPRLRKKIIDLINLLESYGVKYTLQREEATWTDYGFEYVDHNHLNLERIYDACNTPCHEIRGSRFYQCVMARSVEENMFHKECVDYLDLSSLNGEVGKRIMFEYSIGFSERGYMEMCNKCHGVVRSEFVIQAAEQDKA